MSVEFTPSEVIRIDVYYLEATFEPSDKGTKAGKVIVDESWKPELREGVLSLTGPPVREGDQLPSVTIIVPKKWWVYVLNGLRRDRPPA